MHLFLDECLSPRIAANLNAEGVHLVEHPRDFGVLGAPDHSILARCIERDLVNGRRLRPRLWPDLALRPWKCPTADAFGLARGPAQLSVHGRIRPMQSKRLASLRAAFHRFARVEAPGLDSPTYEELAHGVSMDDDLLEIATHTRPHQPPPNMLFAAVQYLLLSGIHHPLAAHYPIISGESRPPTPALPHFRDFCLRHRDRIVELIATRRTQTNVVRRCTCLLPAFSIVCRETRSPLALIDLGASAGLNLNFDHYAYSYQRDGREVLRWGPADARVRLEAELRGNGELPPIPPAIPVSSRDGIDLDPVDLANPDQLLWLRALIWPEHVERHQQLIDAAIEFAHSDIRMHTGDASQVLPTLLESIPLEQTLVVYSTIALYQFPRESRTRIADTLVIASSTRPVWQIALEGNDPELSITRYRGGVRGEAKVLADASPHGWWMEWREQESWR